jgi:GNAT superfamily N-acetyltransferase
MLILREDFFHPSLLAEYADEPYFKLIHRMNGLQKPELPAGFRPIDAGAEAFSRHIRECYGGGPDASEAEFARLFSPENAALRVALADEKTGKIAASGIADFDAAIREGTLEWIQVSPEYRRAGLGFYTVRELLWRLASAENARFVTVSGRLNSGSNPLVLYKKCGFGDEVIWHILTKK